MRKINIIFLLIILLVPIIRANSIYEINQESSDLYTNAYSFNQFWFFDTEDSITTSPAVADFNHDGILEIIIGNDNGTLFCLDGIGKKKIWHFNSLNAIKSSPVVCDIDNDESLEVIFLSDEGTIYCIDSEGKQEWFNETDDDQGADPVIVDFDGDKKLEILIGSDAGNLHCLNFDGSTRWTCELNSSIKCPPAISDFGNDGIFEILIVDNDFGIYCINETGEPIWYNDLTYGISSPSVADLDFNGKKEIIIGDINGYTVCFEEENGTINWFNHTGTSTISNSPSISNLDSDPQLEIIVCNSNLMRCYNFDGTYCWTNTYSVLFASSPAIADINDNDEMIILVGTNTGIMVLEEDGSELYRDDSIGNIVESTPLVMDLDKKGDPGQGDLEFVFGCRNGLVYWYEIIDSTVRKSSAGTWSCYRGSVFHTGNVDSDMDFLGDITEKMLDTSPRSFDTDFDTLSDGMEILCCTNPRVRDTDSDSIDDGIEIYIYGTNPLKRDTDGDFLPDYWEIRFGFEPTIWDWWPLTSGLSIFYVPIFITLIVRIIMSFKIRKGKLPKFVYKRIMKTAFRNLKIK